MRTTCQKTLAVLALCTAVTAFVSNAVEPNQKCVTFLYGSVKHCQPMPLGGYACEKTEYLDEWGNPTYWNSCEPAGTYDSCAWSGTVPGEVVHWWGDCPYNHDPNHGWSDRTVPLDAVQRCEGTNCYE